MVYIALLGGMAAPLVLKIKRGDEFHRLALGPTPDYAAVDEAVKSIWPDSGAQMAKYKDDEGDLCTLVAPTFSDFMATAGSDTEKGHRLLRIEIPCSSASPASPARVPVQDVTFQAAEAGLHLPGEQEETSIRPQEAVVENLRLDMSETDTQLGKSDVQTPLASSKRACPAGSGFQVAQESTHCCTECATDTGVHGPVSGQVAPVLSMEEEMRAEMERIKAACEAELVRHLDEWLATNPDQPTYEHWISAVHPENARRDGAGNLVIDARLYLEDSAHRRIWNDHAANAAEGGAECRRRHVPACASGSSGSRGGGGGAASEGHRAVPEAAPPPSGSSELGATPAGWHALQNAMLLAATATAPLVPLWLPVAIREVSKHRHKINSKYPELPPDWRSHLQKLSAAVATHPELRGLEADVARLSSGTAPLGDVLVDLLSAANRLPHKGQTLLLRFIGASVAGVLPGAVEAMEGGHGVGA